MRKVIIFFLLFLSVMGIVGGIGYTAYAKAYPIAIGVATAAWMGIPEVLIN